MVARIYNPGAQRQSWEDQKFSVVLGYIGSLKPAWLCKVLFQKYLKILSCSRAQAMFTKLKYFVLFFCVFGLPGFQSHTGCVCY